jgi:oligopeptide transport system substrate-binding protein
MLTKNRHLNVALMLALVLALVVPMLGQNVARAADPKKLILGGVQSKGDIPTLDPAHVTDTASAQVVNETNYALVRGLETDLANIQPGMASKWELSSDGTVYTFTIRSGIPWVMWDGNAVVEAKGADGKVRTVTAKDFAYGLMRTLDPRTASEYSYIYTSIIKGAEEFNSSKETGEALDKLAQAVGVQAKDDTTLVITLKEPAAFALGILSNVGATAQPQEAIEKGGDKWTEPGSAWSYGPYVVSQWKHDESLTLVKNPFWPGIENSPKPMIDIIEIPFLDDGPTFSNYEAGTLDAMVGAVPLTEMDRIKADATLSKELNIGPAFSTYYYGFNVTKPPFDNVHMRRAFSYAVDRQAVIDNVTKAGQEPARWFSRPGLAGAPTMKDHPNLGIGYDPEAAKKELQAYLDEMKITKDQIPPIALVMNQVEGHVKIGEAIQQMWQEVLGVKVELTTQEWKVFLEALQTDSPQVWRLGWNLDYADANNFIRDVFYSTSTQNYTKWKSAEYDKLADEAARTTDPAKRTELYAQAEDILIMKEAVIIPIYWYTRVSMTKPYVTRTFSVSSGDERLEKWDINKT